jgi:hypothetical protein
MSRRVAALVTLCLGIVPLRSALAQGHGPAYGLSTPTLGKGGWSLDLSMMSRFVGKTQTLMLRPLLSYGITEDLQVSGSFPMPLYTPQGIRPAHGMSRMPTSPDLEFLLGWRFHRRGTGVGTRLESTLYLGFDYPTDAVRAGVRTAPGLYGAAVAGYASRGVYLWVGGLYRRYMTPVGTTTDHPGDAAMYSLVFGYRPTFFRKNLPHPDWRIFLEAFGERTAPDVIAGVRQPNTGSHQIFVGPTLLGLYGSWGLSGGPVFPVFRRVNGVQLPEKARLVLNTTFWF